MISLYSLSDVVGASVVNALTVVINLFKATLLTENLSSPRMYDPSPTWFITVVSFKGFAILGCPTHQCVPDQYHHP